MWPHSSSPSWRSCWTWGWLALVRSREELSVRSGVRCGSMASTSRYREVFGFEIRREEGRADAQYVAAAVSWELTERSHVQEVELQLVRACRSTWYL